MPPGLTPPAKGEPYPHLGWLARLLPLVEQDALWREAQAAYAAKPGFPFAAPHSGILTPVGVFACPADPRQRDAHDTHHRLRAAVSGYLGVLGTDHERRDGVLFRGSRARLAEVRDGTSNTVLAGERPPSPDFWYGWWYASGSPVGTGDTTLGVRERNPYQDGHTMHCPAGGYRFRPADPADLCATYQFWSLHPGGANFAFCDGSVRLLPYSADGILPALATRAGGEAAVAAD